MYLTFKYVDMRDQGHRPAAKSRTRGGQYESRTGKSRSQEIDHGPGERVLSHRWFVWLIVK